MKCFSDLICLHITLNIKLELIQILFKFDAVPFRSKYKWIHDDEKEEIYALMKMFEKEEPLSAMGFFKVDKPLFVSVISTIITYLIILCQFKL